MAGWIYRSRNEMRHLAALMLLLLLAGCGGEGAAGERLAEYQQWLSEALGVPAAQTSSPPNIDAFPDRDARLFDVAETREGLLNVYALRECHITSLVAARNNQLGRVAPPSQQWIYELELWRRLHACWHSDVAQSLPAADRERLERLTRIKTDQLPRVSWNTLFDSEEWIRSFSRASSPLAPGDTRGIDAQFEAVGWLTQATLNQFNPDWHPESATLENHLKSLRSRPLTAELLRALLLAEQRLTEANAMLVHRLEAADSCQALAAPASDLYLQLAERPALAWLEHLESLAARWLEEIDALLESHIPPPDAIAEYRHRWLSQENPQAPLPALSQARSEHERLWQSLIERCRGKSGRQA